MGAKVLRISPWRILDLLLPGQHKYESDRNPLPQDCKIIRSYIQHDLPKAEEICLIISSNEFGDIPEGGTYPFLDPLPSFRKIE